MHDISIALVSLGCAKNLVDSEMMSALLQQEHYRLVTDIREADVIIVNTCGFIESAKEESIEKILEMAEYKKQKCRALIAAGCLSQRYGDELLKEIPEIDGIFGTNDVYAVALTIKRCLAGEHPIYLQGEYESPEDAPRLLATPKHTAYVKIAEGCDNHCTYCAIPSIRGPYRSRSTDSIIYETMKLAQQGVKEINLIAQDITLYGKDHQGKIILPELLKRLSDIDGITWIRLLYAYPERLTAEIMDTIVNTGKVCNYLDLPLQHATDRILQLMGRKTTAQKIRNLLGELRSRVPDIVLRTSFIIGFPGETESDFTELLAFLREAKLDRVGFFAYSQEEGTPAAAFMGQIPPEVKEERVNRAVEVQSVIIEEKQKRLIGKQLTAMVDGRSAQDPQVMLCRTYMQAPEVDGYVRVRSNALAVGEFATITITGYDGYDLIGTV